MSTYGFPSTLAVGDLATIYQSGTNSITKLAVGDSAVTTGGTVNMYIGKSSANNNGFFLSHTQVADGSSSNYFKILGYGVGAGGFFVQSGGNVGIGTTNPLTPLDVRGQITANVSAPSYQLTDGTYTAQFGLASSVSNYCLGAQAGDATIRTGQPNSSNIFITGSSTFATQFVVQGSTGRVGIGTTFPTRSLHVVTTSGAIGAAVFDVSSSTFNDQVIMGRFLADSPTNTGYNLLCLQSGSSLTNRLLVRGDGQITTTLTSGTISSSSGVLTSSSDSRIKSNITYVSNLALPTINLLKPAYYTFNFDPYNKRLGFIAQDVATSIPEAVDGKKYDKQYQRNDDGTAKLDESGNLIFLDEPRYLGLDSTSILAMCVKSIQELTAKNSDLEARLAALEAK